MFFLPSQFASSEKEKEVKKFFANRTKPFFARTLKQSIEQVQINAKCVQNIRNEKDLAEAVKKLGNQEKVGQSFYILYFEIYYYYSFPLLSLLLQRKAVGVNLRVLMTCLPESYQSIMEEMA